jgi:hypothetical protein
MVLFDLTKLFLILQLGILLSYNVYLGNPSSGINSIAFKNSLDGVMCGGNYEGDELTERGKNFAITKNGGKTWENVEPAKSPSISTIF